MGAHSSAESFMAGDIVTWTGLAGLFSRQVTIMAVRQSYLTIFGETPEDARTVYDIDDPFIGAVVFGVPGEQLRDGA